MEEFENNGYNRDPQKKESVSNELNATNGEIGNENFGADLNNAENVSERENGANGEYFVHRSTKKAPPPKSKKIDYSRPAGDGEFAALAKKEGKGMGIASMVLGIISVCLCCCMHFITLAVAIVGLVLGIISIRRSYNGFALAGIIASAFGILFGLSGIVSLFSADSEFWWNFIESYPPNDFNPNTDASLSSTILTKKSLLRSFI